MLQVQTPTAHCLCQEYVLNQALGVLFFHFKHCGFRWIEHDLLAIEIFCNIIYVLTTNFDEFNASLLNKIINFFQKNQLGPKLFNGRVYKMSLGLTLKIKNCFRIWSRCIIFSFSNQNDALIGNNILMFHQNNGFDEFCDDLWYQLVCLSKKIPVVIINKGFTYKS